PRAGRPSLAGAGRAAGAPVSLSIEPMTEAAVEGERSALVELLRDAVESGASGGVLPPLRGAGASAYWTAAAAGPPGRPCWRPETLASVSGGRRSSSSPCA